MRHRLIFSVGVAASLLLSAAVAKADDREQINPSHYDWSGLLVGVQVGAAWADTGWHFPTDSYFTLLDGTREFDATPHGAIGGGHITIYHQIGSIVLGADLSINGGGRLRVTDYGAFEPILFPTDRFDTNIEHYGTLTARLGFACEDYLFFVSGGYARGDVNFRAISGPPGAGVIGEVDRRLNGATVGGGIERQLTENLVVGLQYDYVRLNGDTVSIATTGTPSTDPFVLEMKDVEIHAVTARLNFKFNPIVSAP